MYIYKTHIGEGGIECIGLYGSNRHSSGFHPLSETKGLKLKIKYD